MRRLLEFTIPLLVVGTLSLSSCSPRIVEHLVYQHDTTYVAQLQVDSIFRRDSIYIREKADTVYQYIERIREHYKFIHDTTFVTRVDSVAVETVKEVKVEKSLSWWQKARMRAFWPLLLGLLAAAVYVFRKPILALLRKFLI